MLQEECEMKKFFASTAALVFVLAFSTLPASAAISGDYIEVRSADVYTGPCYANSEVGLEGKQAILVWKINQGSWNGVKLDGLSVMAVVNAHDTLGDPYHNPYPARSVLIVDQRANPQQQAALVAFAKTEGGKLTTHVVRTELAPIAAQFGSGLNHGTVSVVAGQLARIKTRSLCMADDLCGNESRYYPPLTKVANAMPAYTLDQRYQGKGLGMVWTRDDARSAYIGSFNL